MPVLAALTWHPHLSPLPGSAAFLALAGWLWWLYRRLLRRFPPARARLLLAPKAAVLLLLLLAALDPAWQGRAPRRALDTLLAVVDTSGSMDVKDAGGLARRQRATDAVAALERGLGAGVRMRTLWFDTDLREQAPAPPPPGAAPRGTDLGNALRALAARPDTAAAAGVVLFTDGGDEPVDNPTLPPVPLDVAGIAGDPATWRDLAIADVTCPPTVEKDAQFEIAADIRVYGPAPHRPASLTLERARSNAWVKVGDQTADAANGRARVRFRTSCGTLGPQTFRLTLDPSAGAELTPLNNVRTCAVQVQRASLNVLFFAREVGASLKLIRAELAADPGVTFTALFRTVGERFTVQGERRAGDEGLDAGFPARVETLRLYDVVILDAFPAADWSTEQMRALVAYVEQGGAAVFLGGEQAFGHGGYAGTPLAALLPWSLSAGEPELTRGRFPVSVPPAVADHAAVAGVGDLLVEDGQAAVDSANRPGPLKATATALLNASVGNAAVALAAVQPFGRGKVLAVASNTFWKWARESRALGRAHGLFWRQTMRYLAGREEGGRMLRVTWDRDAYRPGETAVANVRLAGEAPGAGMRLTASVTLDGAARALPVDPAPGQAEGHAVKVAFERRGLYQFALTASRGQETLETYEKALAVAPQLPEGARLELNEAFLEGLAARGGGRFVREADLDKLARQLAERRTPSYPRTETSLVYGRPWFLAAFVLVLVAEWSLRRRLNLF